MGVTYRWPHDLQFSVPNMVFLSLIEVIQVVTLNEAGAPTYILTVTALSW